MPRRSQQYRTPREWLTHGQWPEGAFHQEAPEVVAYAVAIARRLDTELKDQSKSDVARQAQIERSTLYDILAGRSWPDAVTLAKLEMVLGTRLWPDYPTVGLVRR